MTLPNISQCLSSEEAKGTLSSLLNATDYLNQLEFVRTVCEAYDFRDRRSRLRIASCLAALKSVAKQDPEINLPPARVIVANRGPRLLETAIPEPEPVPPTLEAIQGLRIELVTNAEQRQQWNTVIHQDHPQGATTFFGSQVKYLIKSDQGVLGAAGFAAAALKVSDRDQYLGWDHDGRQAHLHQIVCLSRFLIRPSMSCQNLASHVFGKILARLPEDFEQRYDYRPCVVETFVEERLLFPTLFNRKKVDLSRFPYYPFGNGLGWHRLF